MSKEHKYIQLWFWYISFNSCHQAFDTNSAISVEPLTSNRVSSPSLPRLHANRSTKRDALEGPRRLIGRQLWRYTTVSRQFLIQCRPLRKSGRDRRLRTGHYRLRPVVVVYLGCWRIACKERFLDPLNWRTQPYMHRKRHDSQKSKRHLFWSNFWPVFGVKLMSCWHNFDLWIDTSDEIHAIHQNDINMTSISRQEVLVKYFVKNAWVQSLRSRDDIVTP